MGINWQYLKVKASEPSEWGEEDIDEIYKVRYIIFF